LKEYKRHVLWLDYFNSSNTRGEGRRIPLDRSVKDPKLGELVEATKALGYNPQSEVVKHPKRMAFSSGIVSVEKREGKKKSAILLEVAKSLSSVRGRRAAEETSAGAQQKSPKAPPHKAQQQKRR
jgi:signal recognition particle subunit SRP19